MSEQVNVNDCIGPFEPAKSVVPTEQWNGLYWAYNCPLQMWKDGERGWRVVNYMPRKETCDSIDERVTAEEMPQFCKNAAAVLRNLATLFELMADGKIDHIYYPDKDPDIAVADFGNE